MTLLKKVFILLAISLLHQFATGQVIQTFIPWSEGCVIGNAVTVPIIVKYDDTVPLGAISLTILYDPTVLTYQTYNADSLFSTILINNINPGIGQSSIIQASWFSLQPVFLHGIKEVLNLNFIYHGGTTLLQFDTQTSGNCEYADINGIQLQTDNFINDGKVSPH